MAKKRKPESDPFAVLAREWTNDRGKLRRVIEWAEAQTLNDDLSVRAAAHEVLAILNATKRKGKP